MIPRLRALTVAAFSVLFCSATPTRLAAEVTGEPSWVQQFEYFGPNWQFVQILEAIELSGITASEVRFDLYRLTFEPFVVNSAHLTGPSLWSATRTGVTDTDLISLAVGIHFLPSERLGLAMTVPDGSTIIKAPWLGYDASVLRYRIAENTYSSGGTAGNVQGWSPTWVTTAYMVPEPGTFVLVGTGIAVMAGLAARRRRRESGA